MKTAISEGRSTEYVDSDRTLCVCGLIVLGDTVLFAKLGVTTRPLFVDSLVGLGVVVGVLATLALTVGRVLFTLTVQPLLPLLGRVFSAVD
jgi:hypothetical protein